MTPRASDDSSARLRQLSEDAARGRFPPTGWGVEVLDSPPRLAAAVLAFTGHHVVAASLSDEEVGAQLDPDDIAAPFNPSFLAWLGARLDAGVGHVDVVLARLGTGAGDEWLQPVDGDGGAAADGERLRRARAIRADVTVLQPPEGGSMVILGTGLGGRRELSFEIADEGRRSAGLGRRLLAAAVGRIGADEAVFAGVAPGNARSLRCLLAAGFAPIGAECLLTHRPG